MSAEIVNLRQARKRRDRAEKEATAAQNRKVFGRSKADRRLQETIRDRENRQLDGLQRIKPEASETD